MSSLLTSCAPFPCQSGMMTGVSCQVLTCHNMRNIVLMLLDFVDGESHQAKLVSCHLVLYRCLARSHHVTSCFAMSRLRLEFVKAFAAQTQASRYPRRERLSKLNSTVLSWQPCHIDTEHSRNTSVLDILVCCSFQTEGSEPL